ncbi:MAG: hypothetical protein QNI98_03200 [Woeseiaceae bacterium]|nr:hypothetical protein [Woeseiaceae bacterium]
MRRSALFVALGFVAIGFAGLTLHYGRAVPEKPDVELESSPETVVASSFKASRELEPIPEAPPGRMTPEMLELITHGLPIEGCDKFSGTQLDFGREEEQKEEIRKAVQLLSVSGDPEYLIGAALLDFERGDDGSHPLLEQALQQLPEHPVALWHKMQHCRGTGCERSASARALTQADPTNGLMWIKVAAEHIRDGNPGEAEAALRRAIAAPRFDNYFIDYVTVIERALAATTEMDYAQRVVYGIGISAAAAIPMYGDIFNACKSETNDAAVWSPLCDELGQSMADRSRDLMSTMIGHGLRKVAATRVGDADRAAVMQRERDHMQERYIDTQTRVGAHAVLLNDHAVLQRYIDTFRAHGEMRAIDNLVDEAIRLRADETYDQCNFVIRQLDD